MDLDRRTAGTTRTTVPVAPKPECPPRTRAPIDAVIEVDESVAKLDTNSARLEKYSASSGSIANGVERQIRKMYFRRKNAVKTHCQTIANRNKSRFMANSSSSKGSGREQMVAVFSFDMGRGQHQVVLNRRRDGARFTLRSCSPGHARS